MEKYYFDVAIIGAGAVGLAIARQISLLGYSVVVVKKEKSFGFGNSSRNSEVIHAGIYYQNESWKSKLCIRGKELIYAYCESNKVPHKKIGTYIVSCSQEQTEKLNQIFCMAKTNGLQDLNLVSAQKLADLGMPAKLDHAIFSLSTGILDTHQFMICLTQEIEELGGIISYQSEVTNICIKDDGTFETCINDEFIITSNKLINAAGLGAVKLRNMFSGDLHKACENFFVKGSYFGYRSTVPFSNLIYPVPEENGLGVHLTLDLSNRARFGPNAEKCSSIDYSINAALLQTFYDSIKLYWPEVDIDLLYPDYAGIRPKVLYDGQLSDDFIIETQKEHKVAGLINLLGIESTGLTSSLALAETVADFL